MAFLLFDKKRKTLYFRSSELQSNVAGGIYFEGGAERILPNIIHDARFVSFYLTPRVKHRIKIVFLIVIGLLFLLGQIKFLKPIVHSENGNSEKFRSLFVNKTPYSESHILKILESLYETRVERVESLEFPASQIFSSFHDVVRFPLLSIRGVDSFLYVPNFYIKKKFSNDNFYILSNYKSLIEIRVDWTTNSKMDNSIHSNKISSIQLCENNKDIFVFEVQNRTEGVLLFKHVPDLNFISDSKPKIKTKDKHSLVLSSLNQKSLKSACEFF